MKLLLILLITTLLSSCALKNLFGTQESDTSGQIPVEPVKKEESTSKDTSKGTPITSPDVGPGLKTTETPEKSSEISLAQARLMERIDRIELELRKSKERIKLLEQGLLTGITPSGLTLGTDEDGKEKKSLPKNKNLDTNENLGAKNPEYKDPKQESSIDQDATEDKISKAEQLYQSSKFQGALTELNKVSNQNAPADLSARIILVQGRSHLGLKDYETARSELEGFIAGWPEHEETPRVRLDLVKVYRGLGLTERAKNQLKKIIDEYQGKEYADMASQELSSMQRSL